MNNKKLIAVNLNEFNLEFLKYGAKKYKCKYIQKFLNDDVLTYNLVLP